MLTVFKMSLSAGCKYWSIVVYPKTIKVRLGGVHLLRYTMLLTKKHGVAHPPKTPS